MHKLYGHIEKIISLTLALNFVIEDSPVSEDVGILARNVGHDIRLLEWYTIQNCCKQFDNETVANLYDTRLTRITLIASKDLSKERFGRGRDYEFAEDDMLATTLLNLGALVLEMIEHTKSNIDESGFITTSVISMVRQYQVEVEHIIFKLLAVHGIETVVTMLGQNIAYIRAAGERHLKREGCAA